MERNLPIKIVLPKKTDIRKNQGGGKDKFFCECTQELKDDIVKKFENLLVYYEGTFKENIPAVGKIKVKDKAIAKSHKPSRLCQNCEIIGTEKLNEIYVRVSKESILETIKDIKTSSAKKLEANLTAIADITPIDENDRIVSRLKRCIANNEIASIKDNIKIKLFDFGNEYDNSIAQQYVISQLEKLNIPLEQIKYGDKVNLYRVSVQSVEQISDIAKINGIRYVDFFSTYVALDSEIELTKEKTNIILEEGGEYPIIGIIDGGISPTNIYLKDAIYKVEKYVADEYINYSHGTFVASTIQYGNFLNNIDEDNEQKYRFLDVIALPNANPKYGETDSISEGELMEIIEEVVSKYCKKVKVWNLSIGMPDQVCGGNISDLGAFCDYIQDTYKVQFVISSGNYVDGIREWPSQLGDSEEDRIIAPADSVRGITVGAIALKDSPSSVVKANEPSPFSRRGPGANFTIKPDIVDYGGNRSYSGNNNNLKMVGLDLNGNITYGIGTSYAAPRGTRKIANIINQLGNPDLLLAKALLIHSANINSKKDFSFNNEEIKYYGFGMPAYNTEDFMLCSDSEITLVFQQKIQAMTHLELIDFPYPKSLIKNGKYYGEIFMTLAYNPPLNIEYGQEYCRSNVDVSFGTYEINKQGIVKFKGQVPIEKKWDSKFEEEQVENGFKWSPIKSYYRKLSKGIKQSNGWKLRVDMSPRYNENIISQEFVLIITIKDPCGADIYSDVVTALRSNGYITNDLQIRSKVRHRN